MGRLKLLGSVKNVAGELAGRAIELLSDSSAIHSRRKGQAHLVVGEKRMWHLDAAALALHLGPGVRTIEIDVLDTRAGEHPKRTLTPLLCQPLPNILLNLGVP